MGASKGFQSLWGHGLDSTLPLFSLQLRVLGDRFEFEYQLDHLGHVTLVCSFHSMSLSCFLPRAFVFLSWFDTSIHFVVTCWMLWDMFITIFLHCTPITGPILHSLFDPWFNFRLDAHMFITKRWKTHFHIHTFFERVALITLPFFSLMELELKVDSRICGYRWSTDLVIVCFSHLFYLGLLMGIL